MAPSLNQDYSEDTTTMSPIITTTTITTDSLYTSSASPTIMDMWMSQLQKDHPEISFVVPSQHDNQHIDNMMNFKRLLEQVGNTAYDTFSADHQHSSLVDSLGQPITHEQISNSAVLNMADLKNNAMSGLERFFSGADMNSMINYLWVGVVTSLVILTVIFVLFSCYFYRKFREWKKCNKDIRAHLNNDMYPGTIVPCDPSSNPEAAYYQMDMPPPPCYTIATGLPTYDEALHHHQQHFAFGMKFIYPTLAAVHHQATNLMSSWEKYDMQNTKDQGKASTASSAAAVIGAKSSPSKQVGGKSSKCKLSQTSDGASESASELLLPPPSYDVAAASMAFLAPEEFSQGCDNVSIVMPFNKDATRTLDTASGDLTDVIAV
ncbi:protein commissureless 1 [Stomoxys calcitrans]|uniref:Protein commissureless n=1 Tax=Stomoxys calcitrans TaxID=35570 RepID=A0A1I8NUH8_STOCA|nr:protein commissureless 1 [Stomoxys calcitrans]